MFVKKYSKLIERKIVHPKRVFGVVELKHLCRSLLFHHHHPSFPLLLTKPHCASHIQASCSIIQLNLSPLHSFTQASHTTRGHLRK